VFDHVLTRDDLDAPPALPDLVAASAERPSELADEIVGGFLETARLLGQRTAEMHLALASDPEDPDFAPEPFTSLYQRSQYQSMRNGVQRSFDLLRARLAVLAEPAAAEARELLERESELLDVCRGIMGAPLEGRRIRCHGDYHLGQVLYTGNDFAIIDFEGEPARSLGERRLKRSPLRDVAGMLRSFDYAAHFPLYTAMPQAGLRPADAPHLEPWAGLWRHWVSAAFLGGYLPPVREAGLVPSEREPLELLLRVFLMEKSVYELAYELDNRPTWAPIPLRGVRALLDGDSL
jgi:maltose alpha-D-glucosyltransferase/alpha-amylase